MMTIGLYPGIEKEFDQRLMPDGKCNIDGFLCVFDVSIVPNRTLEKQVNNIIPTIIAISWISSSITFTFTFQMILFYYFQSNELPPGGDNSANPEQFDVVKEAGCAGKTSACI